VRYIDCFVFLAFVAGVVAIGLWKSGSDVPPAGEREAKDYFLAGRGLTWWLVGFSLIAANISTEQFVGMSGKAADWLGLAIASYEWMAAVTLVVVAFVFLPKFLSSGIYTIPEFLEYRYNSFARTIMALSTMIILVGVPTASVIFSGAKVVCVFFKGTVLFGLDLGDITVGCWLIGVIAALYVFAGGLKACAWADLIQGAALIVGGAVVGALAWTALVAADPTTLAGVGPVDAAALATKGFFGRLMALNTGKMTMFKPATDPEIPWTALVLGLWIPNFFYWGLNQYITQRTLGSKSLDEGQKGVVFAAGLKLVITFIVVIPGMLAFNLFHRDLQDEAARKNAPVLERFDGGERLAVPFDEGFARLHPERAASIMAHNGRLAGLPTEAPAADPAERVRRNATLVAAAVRTGAREDDRLIGYDHDAAFPTLLRNLLPPGVGLMGFVLAAIFGAVVSSLASMLNSASTIFTMDLYRKVHPDASAHRLVGVGRICTVVFVLVAIVIAPSLGSPAFGGIFSFIQEFQGFISPGILAIFVFGLLVQRAPRVVGTVGLVLNPVLYGLLKWGGAVTGNEFLQSLGAWSFLDRMALCFCTVLAVLAVITLVRPMRTPVTLPVDDTMDMRTSPSTKVWGLVVVVATLVLYLVFSPLGLGQVGL